MPPKITNYQARLDKELDKSKGADACWIWTGATNGKKGYGRTVYETKKMYVHRLAYMLANGLASLAPDQVVMHTCDTPLCCNPKHLRLGTVDENNMDMFTKGRWKQPSIKKGEANSAAKVKEEHVHWIRAFARYGWTHERIASRFGLRKAAVSHIVNRRNWKHV